MKRRTRFALAAMFDNVLNVEIHNTNLARFYPTERYLQELIISIEPEQSGTGSPSPDNVRAITGFTDIDVYVSLTPIPDPGNTYVVDLGGLRYKGVLDVLNGKLVVTHGFVDLASLSWSATAWGGYRATGPSGVASGPITDLSSFVAEKYTSEQAATISTSTYSGNGIALGTAAYPLRWFVHSQDGLSPTGHVVYPLATPIEVSVTPQQIATIRPGKNRVWCNCGEIISLIG